MHKQIEQIKNEGKPKILKNIFSKKKLTDFLIYTKIFLLPCIIKNKMLSKKDGYLIMGKELEELFYEKLSNEIGKFNYDNLKSEDGKDILGLFQESYNPIGLHIDGGFNLDDVIYKQAIPLTPVGSTVIFKIDFMGNQQISQLIKKS